MRLLFLRLAVSLSVRSHMKVLTWVKVGSLYAQCCCCVQVEVIMPATWNVKESHDVALQLQHKVSHTPLG